MLLGCRCSSGRPPGQIQLRTAAEMAARGHLRATNWTCFPRAVQCTIRSRQPFVLANAASRGWEMLADFHGHGAQGADVSDVSSDLRGHGRQGFHGA